ncbi:hypothetical protein ACFYUJ_39585 [Streptomyces sp. NPDC004520]|uniref:hypothetical protein n=1 Tax=Streptomyces sp. NPDC004520 TaxID=3364702 RepID=UPI0036A239DE
MPLADPCRRRRRTRYAATQPFSGICGAGSSRCGTLPTEWIHWQSDATQPLPRPLARRSRGPLFLTGRKAPAGTTTLDVSRGPAGPGSPTVGLS